MNANAWDQAAGMARQHAKANGLFIRLSNNGDKVVGAFCGEPFPREVVWTGERYETFDAEAHKGKRASLRVSLNFYIPEEGTMKVIEGGAAWFKDVLKVRDKYGLDLWLFEIERHGEAGDPKTKYTILPEEKLSEAQHEEIASLQLHDLAALSSGESDTSAEPPESPNPLPPQVIAEVVSRLKALPREAVPVFLRQMNIERLRELRAHQEKATLACITRIEADFARRTAFSHPDVDPFG